MDRPMATAKAAAPVNFRIMMVSKRVWSQAGTGMHATFIDGRVKTPASSVLNEIRREEVGKADCRHGRGRMRPSKSSHGWSSQC